MHLMEGGGFNPTELENNESKESRFPNKKEVLEIMSLGMPEFLGSIDKVYSGDVAVHTNIVEVININTTELTKIRYNGKELRCIFKPFSGESESAKSENKSKIQKFYPREMFAFALSEHLSLDIVPPTVVRDFGDGKIGALQLFVSNEEYLSQQVIEQKHPQVDIEGWDKMAKSLDFAKMMAFDFIVANCDRNEGNYLVKINKEGEEVKCGIPDSSNDPQVIAIDHGMCMDTDLYLKVRGPKDGPIKIVTESRDNVPIPEEVLTALRDGYKNRDTFFAELVDSEITEEEVNYMWMRLAALCESGIFISKYNIKKHIHLVKNGPLSKHPQLFFSI